MLYILEHLGNTAAGPSPLTLHDTQDGLMQIDPKVVAIIVVAIIVVIVIAVIVVRQRRKAALLRQRFGREYERVARERGSEREAQTLLTEREKRVEKFHIRELDEAERQEYAERWRMVQTRFVDDPSGAVSDADEAVVSLMGVRGYPMADFEQRAADLSVDHPHVVENYRAAHAIAVRRRQGTASTEDLRRAMIYYRSLFEDLLGEGKTRRIREVA